MKYCPLIKQNDNEMAICMGGYCGFWNIDNQVCGQSLGVSTSVVVSAIANIISTINNASTNIIQTLEGIDESNMEANRMD